MRNCDVAGLDQAMTLLELYQTIGGILVEFPETAVDLVVIQIDPAGKQFVGLRRTSGLLDAVMAEPNCPALQSEMMVLFPAFDDVLPGQELAGFPVGNDKN